MPDDTHREAARVAVITPIGEGGIGVITVAGALAGETLDRVFVGTKRRASDIPPGGIAHGTIRRNGDVLDEVIVARPARKGEDSEPRYEVNCHGGVVAVRAVAACLEEAGARAVPWRVLDPDSGNGPPLEDGAIRAQALARLPRAATRLAATMLLYQAGGALSRELAAVREALASGRAEEAETRLERLLRTAALGRALLRPPRVALLGPPNAGKSTLLNALLEEERVIVHHKPGTTRDVVAATVSLRGVPFELLDCAGVGRAHDELDRQAMERARGLASSCDVALLLWDVAEGLAPLLAWLPDVNRDARAILVGNKIDLLPGGPPSPEAPPGLVASEAAFVSAKQRTNLELLEKALLRPYEGLIEPCREGGAVIFDAAQESQVRRVRELLGTEGAEAAGGALQPATGETEQA